MLAHMSTVRGIIYFRGLISSLARDVGLDNELENLAPLQPRTIDLDCAKSMSICKHRGEDEHPLMIHNEVVQSIVLQWPRRLMCRQGPIGLTT